MNTYSSVAKRSRGPTPIHAVSYLAGRNRTNVIKGVGVWLGFALLTVTSIWFKGEPLTTEASRAATLFLAVALLLVLWICPLTAAARDPAALASPLPLQSLGYTVFFLIPAVHTALDPSMDRKHLLVFYPAVLALLGYGYLSLMLCYHLRLGLELAAVARRVVPLPAYGRLGPRSLPAAFLLLAVGWSARAALAYKGVFFHTSRSEFYFTPVANLLGQLAWLCKIAFIFALLRWVGNPRRTPAALLALALGALEGGFALASGGRQILAELAAYTAVSYLLVRRRLPWLGLVPAVIAAVLLFSLIAEYRREVTKYMTDGAISVTGTASALVTTVARHVSDLASIRRDLEEFNWRNSDINSVAAFIRDTPSIHDFQYGKTYVGLLFFFVPRVLWPDKPSLIVGFETTQRYFPDQDPHNYASSPATLIGEFYINFGVFGVILGMGCWGLFLRFLYEYTRAREGTPSAYLLLYVFSSSYMMWVSQTAGVLVAVARAWLAASALGLIAQLLSSSPVWFDRSGLAARRFGRGPWAR